MQKDVYIFNPDTDLVNSSNTCYYMATSYIEQMTKDLSALPAWLSKSSERYVISNNSHFLWNDYIEKFFGIKINFITEKELTNINIDKVIPWGWDKKISFKLRNYGIDESIIPTDSYIEMNREMSSRVYSTKLIPLLKERLPYSPICIPEKVVVKDVCQLEDLRNLWGEFILKTNWSSSGKGIMWVDNTYSEETIKWCQKAIRKNGCIVAEPAFEKIVDFAMEYRVHNGKAEHLGLSVFKTDKKGKYEGNIVASEDYLRRILEGYVDGDILDKINMAMIDCIENVYNRYEGELGVDMMIVRRNGIYQIMPIVEVNLRLNMGILAISLGRQLLYKNSTAVFRIVHISDDAEDYLRKMKEEYPLIIKEGHIVEGFLELTPIRKDSIFAAILLAYANDNNLQISSDK